MYNKMDQNIKSFSSCQQIQIKHCTTYYPRTLHPLYERSNKWKPVLVAIHSYAVGQPPIDNQRYYPPYPRLLAGASLAAGVITSPSLSKKGWMRCCFARSLPRNIALPSSSQPVLCAPFLPIIIFVMKWSTTPFIKIKAMLRVAKMHFSGHKLLDNDRFVLWALNIMAFLNLLDM